MLPARTHSSAKFPHTSAAAAVDGDRLASTTIPAPGSNDLLRSCLK